MSDSDRWEPTTIECVDEDHCPDSFNEIREVRCSGKTTLFKYVIFIAHKSETVEPMFPGAVEKKATENEDWGDFLPIPCGHLGMVSSHTEKVVPPDKSSFLENGFEPTTPSLKWPAFEDLGFGREEALRRPHGLSYKAKIDLLRRYMYGFAILDDGGRGDEAALEAITKFTEKDFTEIPSDEHSLYSIKTPYYKKPGYKKPSERMSTGSTPTGGYMAREDTVDRSDPRSPSQEVVDMYGGDEELAHVHWCNTH